MLHKQIEYSWVPKLYVVLIFLLSTDYTFTGNKTWSGSINTNWKASISGFHILGKGFYEEYKGTDYNQIIGGSRESLSDYGMAPVIIGGDTVTETASPFTVNTGGSFSSAGIRKATQALWISCKAAIDAGVLDMTINPTTVAPIASGQEYFILTQTTTGTDGNTAITLVTGVLTEERTRRGKFSGIACPCARGFPGDAPPQSLSRRYGAWKR